MDLQYFQSYNSLEIHELMLKDKIRNLTYLKFIEENKLFFQNKVILDVGSGTGILSLFAAKYGAKKVYGVEAANEIADISIQLINYNKFQDIITIIKGKIEDIELPEKVDIIISEWMGFYLLHESMLNSVLFARDKWLKKDGKLFPSKAIIYICPISMEKFYEDKIKFWENIYGFDFTPITPLIKSNLFKKPEIDIVLPEQLLSKPQIFKEIDCFTVTMKELQMIQKNFSFLSTKKGKLHGFCCWFDIIFDNFISEQPIILSTSPNTYETHWKQSIFFLPNEIFIQENDFINCNIIFEVAKENFRHYNVSIEMKEDNTYSNNENSESEMNIEKEETNCDCGRCKLLKALELQEDLLFKDNDENIFIL